MALRALVRVFSYLDIALLRDLRRVCMVMIDSRQVLSSVGETFGTALFSAQERIINKKKQAIIRIA
jgi:hypothetical protein